MKTTRPSQRSPNTTRHSAGGLVLSRGRVLVVRQLHNTWSLPKGHLEPGETPLEAAKREILEESGIRTLTFIRPLGSYTRYQIGLDGKDDMSKKKHIIMFLFTTTQTKLRPQDPATPEAVWLPPAKAVARLTHPKDRAFLKRALQAIKQFNYSLIG